MIARRTSAISRLSLDLVHVDLELLDDLGVGVDHPVAHGVHHRGRAVREHRLVRLEVVARRVQLGALAVADADDEVVAHEEVDLAGLHGVVLVDVPERLEDEEEAVLVALELGALVGVEGVLDGQRVQPEGHRHVLELGLGRLEQAHPHEVAVVGDLGPHLVQVLGSAVDGDPDSLAVQSAVDDHDVTVAALRSRAWQP